MLCVYIYCLILLGANLNVLKYVLKRIVQAFSFSTNTGVHLLITITKTKTTSTTTTSYKNNNDNNTNRCLVFSGFKVGFQLNEQEQDKYKNT